MSPLFFKNKDDFRTWLSENHHKESALLVGFYKIGSGKANMTWSESVDQALCFGWIDGVRKGIDDDSYFIRFTPRKKTSIWSNVNIQKMAELMEKGLVTSAGIEAFQHRNIKKSGIYSFENPAVPLSASFLNIFKRNKKAWDFFHKQAPSYQKQMISWIMTAKQESTQFSRLEKTIAISAEGKKMLR